jgi:sulfide dehydrogenase cytochrome subunit
MDRGIAAIAGAAVRRLWGGFARSTACIFAALCLPVPAGFAADADWLEEKLPICESCHGVRGGGGLAGFPILFGQNRAYLERALQELQSERSHSPVMQGITSNLGAAEIKRLAAYFAAQPYVRPEQPTDPEKVKRGQMVYQQVCSNCHTDEGRGSSFEDVPLLAGQNLPYLLQEIYEIVNHKRHVEVIKRGMVMPVSREGLEAAAHFFASRSVTPEQVIANRGGPEKPTRRSRQREDR